MEYFEKVISGFRPLIVFAKCSISDVRQSSEYPSVFNLCEVRLEALMLLIVNFFSPNVPF